MNLNKKHVIPDVKSKNNLHRKGRSTDLTSLLTNRRQNREESNVPICLPSTSPTWSPNSLAARASFCSIISRSSDCDDFLSPL